MFSSVFRGAGACGVAKAIYKNFVFPTRECAAGLNNNNNNNNKSANKIFFDKAYIIKCLLHKKVGSSHRLLYKWTVRGKSNI